MTDDPHDDRKPEDQPKSHRLLWLIVGIFLVLSVVGMWSIDYIFSPEAMAAHKVHNAAED